MKCPSWFDKFEDEIVKENPDIAGICGLMTLEQVELAKKYITFKSHLVEEYGIDQDVIRSNLSMRAVENLLKFPPNNEVRSRSTKIIAKCLLDLNRRLTKPDVDKIIGYAPKSQRRTAINPAEIRLAANPQISLTNTPKNERRELLNQFIKLAGNSIGVYQELAKRNDLEDEYVAFISGVSIIQKYLNGEIK
jgi:hypothetical protein